MIRGIKFMNRHALFSIFSVLIFGTSVSGQTLEQGRTLYREKKYAEAAAVFEPLIKKTPNNASLNQWYGVSLFETGRYDRAEKHLLFAAKRNIQEAYRYLGDLYMIFYQFDKAIENYNKYKKMVAKNKEAVAETEKKIAQAQRGKRMLERVEEVQIIDSLIVDKKEFFTRYKMSAEAGNIRSFNEFFKENRADDGIVYQTQRGDKIIYSEKKDGHYDLYSRNKLADETWSEAARLPETVNSPADENYPFLLSDGVTLYFSSTGNESLGGYDIFVTRYNLNSGTFLTPENVGMPFNSPFNDYLLAIDELNNVGWFATDRFQPEDKIILYLFIPNVEKKIYKGDDPQQMRDLARITSIRQTWKEKDYDALLHQVYNDVPPPPQSKGDFIFVVNNNILYTMLSDFDSEEARNLFIKSQEAAGQIARTEEQLAQLRKKYTASKTQQTKLAPVILKLEEKLLTLYGLPEKYELQARNTEINYLKTHQGNKK